MAHVPVFRNNTPQEIQSGWGADLHLAEAAHKRQKVHRHLKNFIKMLQEQVSALPPPDYQIVESDYIAIGWNLITQRVFVYQSFWWDPMFGSDEAINPIARSTMMLTIALNEEPGHVTGLVLPERTSPILEGVRVDYSLEPLLGALRTVRNIWRAPDIQLLYSPITRRPINAIFGDLPDMPNAHELVSRPRRAMGLWNGCS